MVSHSVITVSANGGISLARPASKTDNTQQSTTDTAKSSANDEVEDTIDFNLSSGLAEKIASAESLEDIQALLKEGQAEISASIDKFKNLFEQRGGSFGLSGVDLQQHYLDSVRSAVVDFLNEKHRNPTGANTADFESRLVSYLRGDTAQSA